jgi:hypothetical protein
MTTLDYVVILELKYTQFGRINIDNNEIQYGPKQIKHTWVMPFLCLIPLMGSHVSKWGRPNLLLLQAYLLSPKNVRLELGWKP